MLNRASEHPNPSNVFNLYTKTHRRVRAASKPHTEREGDSNMPPKNEKTKLGRALVRQHNQLIQQTKEKGIMYRKMQKKVLESVTEVSDIDAVIEQADEADRLFSLNNPNPNLLINL